jgi:predicted nucleotidyltransferase
MIKEGKKIRTDRLSQKLSDVIDILSGDNDIVCFFAFGSLTHGKLNPLSDLDFAVLLSYRLNPGERFQKHLDLIGTLNGIFKTDDVDLVIMNDAPMRFSYNIIKTGNLLICKDKKEFIDFRHRTIMHYLDFKFFRDNFDREFLAEVGYHG